MAAFLTTNDGDVKILEVAGRLDPGSWRDLSDTMNKLTESGETKDLVVDMEKLEYMASAGFRELFLAGKKLARDGGRLAVCSLQGEVKRVFELAGFATAYPIFDTRAEALAFMKNPA
jgi:anti-anti-sigma factor